MGLPRWCRRRRTASGRPFTRLHWKFLRRKRDYGREDDRLKLVKRKVNEKTEYHRRTFAECNRAFDVLNMARLDASSPTSPDVKYSLKSFLVMCEALVRSWSENVEISQASLSSWEFKSNRQTTVVITRVSNELHAAQAKAAEADKKINENLSQVQAMSDL